MEEAGNHDGTDGRAPQGPIAVALSGGGYRASLLAIGALLALADRGLNRRVVVISSVSGGSITNAVVAESCEYETLEPGGLDERARELVKSFRYSVFPAPSTILVFATFGMLAMWAAIWSGLSPVAAGMLAVLAFLVVLQALSGRLLWLQIARVFEVRLRLGHVQSRRIAHEFCATDLVTGLPITFSSKGSEVRRRTESGELATTSNPSLPLAKAVRASAAFPGIAPMILRSARVVNHDPGRLMFCADGGIWNNLGTQALEDDPTRGSMPVLCVNASALPRPASVVPFFIPGMAQVVAMVRSAAILNRNTVAPRLAAIDRDFAGWAGAAVTTTGNGPPAVVVDMSSLATTVRRLSDLKVEVGLGSLTKLPWWTALAERDTCGEIRTRTKLARVNPAEKRALVLRGYANTWLATLFLLPFDERQVNDPRVRVAADRLDTIAPRTASRVRPIRAVS